MTLQVETLSGGKSANLKTIVWYFIDTARENFFICSKSMYSCYLKPSSGPDWSLCWADSGLQALCLIPQLCTKLKRQDILNMVISGTQRWPRAQEFHLPAVRTSCLWGATNQKTVCCQYLCSAGFTFVIHSCVTCKNSETSETQINLNPQQRIWIRSHLSLNKNHCEAETSEQCNRWLKNVFVSLCVMLKRDPKTHTEGKYQLRLE